MLVPDFGPIGKLNLSVASGPSLSWFTIRLVVELKPDFFEHEGGVSFFLCIHKAWFLLPVVTSSVDRVLLRSWN